MDQGEDIGRMAEDVIAWRGAGAYAYLCEQAEMARLIGDRDSAITWWDIALAVVEIRNVDAAA
jgi:hypothetical protein